MRLTVSNCTADTFFTALFLSVGFVSADHQPFRPDRRGRREKDARNPAVGQQRT
jgi:hypothetical protein